MKQYFSFANLVFALAITAFIIGFSAFSQRQKDDKHSFRKEYLPKDDDTSASAKRNSSRDSWNMDLLEDQMKQLDIQMKNLDNQMKQIDLQKIQIETEKAIEKIDVEKITKDIDKAVKDIDWKKINNELEENISNVSKFKTEQIRQQMEQLKANLEKQKFDFQSQKFKETIERSMQNARKSLESAKQQMKNMQQFTDALEKDGLIDKSKPYKIEVRNGELYINDKKQSKEINDKYRHFYKKSDFKIDTNEEDEIRI